MQFDGDGLFQIWTSNPDLSHQVQLTHGPDDGWWPTWSPDGTRIAFSSTRSDPDPSDGIEVQDVFTMRADGTGVRKLTDTVGWSGNPSWSPDGRTIVFSSTRDSDPQIQGIYVMASNGRGPITALTHPAASSIGQELPRYAPDGKRIVFTDYRLVPAADPDDPPEEQSALFTIRPDGRDLRQLTSWDLHGGDPDWSPDGKRIVFTARLAEHQHVQTVMVIDANGQHLRELSQGDGVFNDETPDFIFSESFNAGWSPDGSWIVFSRARFTELEGFNLWLMKMRPDGSGAVDLSPDRVAGHQADWGTAPLFR